MIKTEKIIIFTLRRNCFVFILNYVSHSIYNIHTRIRFIYPYFTYYNSVNVAIYWLLSDTTKTVLE